MSPRNAAPGRFAIVVLIAFAIVTFIPQSAYAQSCTPPTVVQIGGMNPSCANAPVTLDAGDGWMAYQWSNGATTRTITDAPASTTAYTVTTTNALGCQVTSTPYEIAVNATLAPPVIDLYDESICPGTMWGNYAMTAEPPAGTEYLAYQWTIVNGTLPYGGTTANVTFYATGTDPVELQLTVTDGNGCQATSGATVPLRSIPPPAIELYEPSICPNSYWGGYASVTPPPAGINYQSYEWSIVNGAFPYGNTSSSVSFTSNGAGPVQLSVKVTESHGCVATGSTTVPLRSIPPPTIELYEPSICPNSNWGGYASVTPPPAGINYQSYEWTIVNGAFPYGNTSQSVSFTSNGAGPVQLSVKVTESHGCEATGNATVPLRSIPPPSIDLYRPSICPGPMGNYASVASPPPGVTYQNYQWSIVHGTLPYGSTNSSVTFTADGSGPVELTVTVMESHGCVATKSITVPLGAGTPPPISVQSPTFCSTEPNHASVSGTYSSYLWSVANGTILYGQGTNQIDFAGDGRNAITLSVNVNDYNGCPGSNSVVVPAGAPPVPIFTPANACVGSLQKAQAAGIIPYSDFTWTATNATIEGSSNQQAVLFRANGNGPVTLSLNALDYYGCRSANTVTIPLGPMTVPDIKVSYDTICPLGYSTAYLYGNEDVYASYEWTVTNVVSLTGQGTPGIQFDHQPGAGDVTITLRVGEGACSATTTRVIPVRAAVEPVTELATTTVCPNGSGTIYVDNYDSFSYVSLYVTNGSILGVGAGRVSGGRTITFRSDGYGDVTVLMMADSNSCNQQKTFNVPMLAAPLATISASGPTTFCTGGSVTLSVPTQSGASYAWSNGATTPSITVSTAGTFTVSVTTAAGCSRTSAPVSVTINPRPVAGIQSVQLYDDTGSGTMTRDGDQIEACGNPTIRLISSALNASYSYLWSTGATTAVINVTTSGNYTLTVTTPGGCATTSTVAVHYGAIPPKPTIAAPNTELCPAGGSVTLTAPNADAWTWSNGAMNFATTQSIVVTEPGSYTVRVRSGACDSVLSDPVVITTGLSTISTGDSLALCGPGSTATLTANAGTSWLWSNGATTRSIVVSAAGTFSVTTTNAGCTMPESSPVTVTARAVTIDANGPTTFCEGGSVTLTASDGTSWLWSNGATTRSITTSTSGSYGVTATFADGCAIAATPLVVEARHVTATVTADRTTVCTGGAIHLNASAAGGAGYTYQWYDNTYAPIAGATSSSLTVTPATSGFVYVKVRDELGCEATGNSTIYTVLPTPDATITAAAALCEGQTGSASVADAGAGVTYSWTITNGSLSFPNASSVTFTPNGPGTVTLSVTIANAGCSVTSSKNVTIDALNTATITPSGATTFCAGGSVTLTASAGSSYLWSTGATTPSIVASSSGNYSVTVTNASGCSATSSATTVTVNALPAATITPSGATTFCAGGSVTLTASTGSSYLWSTGATTPSIVASSAGNYSVTVTNASGCSATSSATTVTVNALPTATITPSGATTFCAGGSVTLTASAGSSYLWSTGATTPSIVASSSGNYSVTVTNASGCSATSSATNVTVNALPTATITPSGSTTFCAGGSVTLTASAGSSYLWSTGATTPSIVASSSGNYTVTITNASGCSATSSAKTVTVNPKPTPTITPSGATTFCAGGSVTLTASAGSSYLWSTGATTPSINVTSSGNYSVTITNASGCSATSAATTVTVNAKPSTPTITASGPTTFCTGGSVTLTAPAGFTYLWSNGAVTQSINATAAGSYTVTVKNASGCSATSSATTVTLNAPTQITTQPQSKTIPRNTTTQLSVGATGTGALSYQWFSGTSTQINGATSSTYTTPRLGKGTYTYWVRVTGTCGAVNSNTATVSVP